MTTAELKRELNRLGLRPSRKLGQNYLIDAGTAEAIVRRLDVESGDTVVEIGAGMGALSERLAAQAARLILLETDARAASWLRERFADLSHVEVLPMDALHYDFRPLFARQPVKLIGNLPYSCGGAILRKYLTPPHPFACAVFMLQKEVAERVVAAPRSKDYGAFSLHLQAHWTAAGLKRVGPTCFYPQPKVDSAVIRLEPRAPGRLPAFDHRGFDRLLRQGFSQRRKQLKKLLPMGDCDWEELAASLRVSPMARAEELSLDQWIALTNALDDHPLKALAQSGDEIFDVVDESDQVIRQETRRRVHEEGLRHRAVHIFVFNKRGDLFLQKRSHLKDVHPNLWDSSAAGHLDSGEAYEAAALRELDEELGIRTGEVARVTKLPASPETGWEHVELFTKEWSKALRYPCSEVATGGYFGLDLIEDWIRARPQDFASGFLECFRAYQER